MHNKVDFIHMHSIYNVLCIEFGKLDRNVLCDTNENQPLKRHKVSVLCQQKKARNK